MTTAPAIAIAMTEKQARSMSLDGRRRVVVRVYDRPDDLSEVYADEAGRPIGLSAHGPVSRHWGDGRKKTAEEIARAQAVKAELGTTYNLCDRRVQVVHVAPASLPYIVGDDAIDLADGTQIMRCRNPYNWAEVYALNDEILPGRLARIVDLTPFRKAR